MPRFVKTTQIGALLQLLLKIQNKLYGEGGAPAEVMPAKSLLLQVIVVFIDSVFEIFIHHVEDMLFDVVGNIVVVIIL